MTPVLHEDDAVLDADDLVEPEVAEELCGVAFRVEKQVHVAAAVLVRDQMGDDRVHEAFALVSAADCHTAQRVAKAAAGSNDVHVVIVHAACVIKVSIPADPLCQEQFVDLVVGVSVCGINLGNSVFGHDSDPFVRIKVLHL